MKILFYHYPPQTAAISFDVHISEVFNHMTVMGHTIIYVNGKHHKPLEPMKPQSVTSAPSPKSYWVIFSEYVMTLPFRGEALVSFNFLKELRLFYLALRTSLKEKPDLIYKRHGFLTIFHSEYIISKIFKIPVIEEVNGIAVDEARISNKGDSFLLHIIGALERRNLPGAHNYVVVTPKLKVVLRDDFKIQEDKIIVIENGANTDLFKPMETVQAKAQLKLAQDGNYICFVGVLSAWQGVEYLLKAFPIVIQQYPDARLLIVGDGPKMSELVELSGKLDIAEQVIFTGSVLYERVPLYINASEMCTAPFVEQRNQRIGLSPLKLCEYLACAKPVIASRISGLELVEENHAGMLVAPEDPQILADTIIKLLREPELRKVMGENGRKYVVENRSWESVAAKVAVVCEQALQERRDKRISRKS